jgi:hypothetical protein
MIISILPGNGKEPPVEPGEFFQSHPHDEKRLVKLMKTQHLTETYSQSLKN